jgi:hypothetical protein
MKNISMRAMSLVAQMAWLPLGSDHKQNCR